MDRMRQGSVTYQPLSTCVATSFEQSPVDEADSLVTVRTKGGMYV
jgi:hypothetical protein